MTTTTEQPVAPFVIGTDEWPGLAKVIEECSELGQVAGKLIAFPDGDHPDGGPPLVERYEDELGDAWAAIYFVLTATPAIDRGRVCARATEKLELFRSWHEQAGGGTPWRS